VSSEAMVGIARFVWSHPICRKGRLRAFARVAYWQVRSRLQEDVVVPWIGGQRLIVRRGMTGVTGNIYAGLHEFADMALVLHFLRPDDDLFFDIGAMSAATRCWRRGFARRELGHSSPIL
jgi:hypothetical protein